MAPGLISGGLNDSIEDDVIDALLGREVETPEPTPDECRRFYALHQADYTAGELVFARHILFAVTPGVPVGLLRSKAE